MARFRLAPVLKLRQHREEARKRDLAVAVAVENERKATTLRLAALRRDEADLLRRGQQAGPLDIRMIIDHEVYIGQLDRQVQQQLQRVAQAERESAARRGQLVEAVKDRKALETLRDRVVRRAAARQARLEALELDEVAIRVHAAGRRPAPEVTGHG